MIEAQGVEARIKMLALNDAGRGRNTTHAYAKSGKTISFPMHAKYTNELVNSFLKSIVASLIPRINMHMGVVILPKSEMESLARSGSHLEAPMMYKGSATRIEKNVGFMMAAFGDMYFLSCVRQ